ncbi:MAG: FHIPEP family type III secretion protein [Planctomycetota bacterium]|jgi:hypothetical protein
MKPEASYKIAASESEPRIVCRNIFLLLAGGAAVLGALFCPLSSYILDVLLIFSICLTAAVLLITFSARESSQVQNFPLLIAFITTVRVGLSVASAKMILLQGQAGSIIDAAGRMIVRDNPQGATVVFCVLTVLMFGIIFKIARDISRTSTALATDIITSARSISNGNLSDGPGAREQNFSLHEATTRQAGFFAGMGGAARFVLCAAVVELAVIVFSTLSGFVAGSASMSPAVSVRTYLVLCGGAGMVIQLSALLTAVASRRLVRKTSAGLAVKAQFSGQCTDQTKIVRRQAGGPDGAEPQQDTTTDNSEPTAPIDAEFIEILDYGASYDVGTCEAAADVDIDWPEQRLTKTEKKEGQDNSVPKYDGDEYYEATTRLIESAFTDQAKGGKTILLAAEHVGELPVTIPVNIAMQQAQKGRRCLLIDLDPERDAIAKVFDIEAAGARNERTTGQWAGQQGCFGIDTCVGNLSVLPASDLCASGGDVQSVKLRQALSGLDGHYDRVILYAPNLGHDGRGPLYWEQIAGSVQVALFFGQGDQEHGFEESPLNRFGKVLEGAGCRVLSGSDVLAEAL